MFGDAFTQINPIRDPALTVAPTIGPIVNTIAPIRTVAPIRTISPGTVVINRTTTFISSSVSTESATESATESVTESVNDDTDVRESAENLTLVYALVPIGILALILVILCVRRKRAINNNNVVNIDLNIENVLPSNNNTNTNALVKQDSVNSDRFSNHIYEAVDYEARYEMPTIGGTETAKYENVFTGDKGKNNEYGSQVTTIV
tara:strand:+ start:71 stop:685 length:615 start_codon:yes stop_codon:yes gene_type:complete